MSEQPQQEPQAPTFTSGFDFLNHHLNLAMRLVERITPKDGDKIGPTAATRLADLHIELARVGALASIAQQVQAHGQVSAGAMHELTEALNRVAIQMQEARGIGVEEPWDVVEEPHDPAQDLVAPLPPQYAGDGSQAPQAPVTRFQQRQAEREDPAQDL